MSKGSALAVPAGTEISESPFAANSAVGFSAAGLDAQITTAKRYPRSVADCLAEARDLACHDPAIAAACTYALPRAGKSITGPSIKLAEIIAYCWGNLRTSGMIVSETATSVVAQAICLDLEKNVGFSVEARRRITDKGGKRFNDDMIGTTANAAISIAIRNAIFRCVPRVYVDQVLSEAQAVAAGDAASLTDRREKALATFAAKGVTEAEIFKALGVNGREDIGFDQVIILQGFWTSVKEGSATLDDIFRPAPEPAPAFQGEPKESRTQALGRKLGAKDEKPADGKLFPAEGKGAYS